MQIKIVKLPLLFLMVALYTSLLFSMSHAKADDKQQTMLWEMRPNESLIELAAKFYPKSVTMQRAFIAKTQQLNHDTQVYANANARYPTATNIVIPTLKSLSVRGSGAKKVKHSSKINDTAISKTTSQDEQQLAQKKEALDASIAEKAQNLKVLEEKMHQLKQQFDSTKQTTVNR